MEKNPANEMRSFNFIAEHPWYTPISSMCPLLGDVQLDQALEHPFQRKRPSTYYPYIKGGVQQRQPFDPSPRGPQKMPGIHSGRGSSNTDCNCQWAFNPDSLYLSNG